MKLYMAPGRDGFGTEDEQYVQKVRIFFEISFL